MNKKILIAGGLVLILALLGVWGYILIYGTPERVEEVFSNFNFSSEQPAPAPQPSTTENDADFTTEPPGVGTAVTPPGDLPALRQLTTEPVAGFQLVAENATNTAAYALYAKAGTGHIYRHDLTSNQRERLSNFTIPQAHDAYFTRDGQYGVVISGFTTEQRLHIFDLEQANGTNTDPKIIPIDARNFGIGEDNTLFYTVVENNQTRAFAYDFTTNTDRELFRTPLTQITVAWGPSADNTHYFYPRAATGLESPVFIAQQGTIRRGTINVSELSLFTDGTRIGYSFATAANERLSFAHHTNASELLPFSTPVLADKCYFVRENSLLCAASFEAISMSDWYKGSNISGDDLFWNINYQRGTSRSLANLSGNTGRDIAVERLLGNQVTALFRNRLDGNLWVYAHNLIE